MEMESASSRRKALAQSQPPGAVVDCDSRTLGRMALIAVLLLYLLASATAPAAAGTYVIDNCPAAPGANGDPGPWVGFGAPQGYDGNCAHGPGDFIGPLGASMAATQVDGVQVSAPAGSGITIRKARLWWYVPRQSSGADNFAIATDNGGALLESATPLNETAAPSDFAFPSGTTQLTLADYCSNDAATAPCVFSGYGSSNLELLGSELTLADSSLPAGSVTGGSLTSGAALSGTQSASFSAIDGSSGVRRVQLRIDGNVVAQKDYLPSCPYTSFLACPPSVSDSISWNTAGVADGEHLLSLIVQSAAENTSLLYDGTITTRNSATASSPLGTTPGPGAAEGSGKSGAPNAGNGNVPNGHGASESAQLRLGTGSAITRDLAHSALQLRGRLLSPDGEPITAAALQVIATVAGTNRAEAVAGVLTGADGTFTVAVPDGPSRTINVNYRALPSDSSYAARASVTEVVAANVRLEVTPRRTGPEGKISFAGIVHGPIPQHGVIVDLLVHYRGQWVPFRTPRTDARGHFHANYKFGGGVGRFPFRAAVPGGQAGLPFGAGRSRVVYVTTG